MAKKKEMKVHTGPAARNVGEDAFSPLVDIYEDENHITFIVAEIPGAKSETVDVRVDKGVLTIAADGTLPAPEGRYDVTYNSFVPGRYFRAFALSDEIDRDRIDATLTDGTLTIRLPRAAAAQTRKIEIKGD